MLNGIKKFKQVLYKIEKDTEIVREDIINNIEELKVGEEEKIKLRAKLTEAIRTIQTLELYAVEIEEDLTNFISIDKSMRGEDDKGI